jgi:hypothetical protein
MGEGGEFCRSTGTSFTFSRYLDSILLIIHLNISQSNFCQTRFSLSFRDQLNRALARLLLQRQRNSSYQCLQLLLTPSSLRLFLDGLQTRLKIRIS